ncbi:MAG: hypothetical protein ACIAQZ_15640 [Sedimentisphaeraceae bacterium JB056]
MKDIKVIDCKASDNEYLHKDFHGALCYAIKYLEDNYGTESVEEYLQQVARTYYKPLTDELKANGLQVLENHWNDIFNREDGEFELGYEGKTLVLKVDDCPAVSHLKKRGLFYTDNFCLTTKIVNETICKDAGFCCSCNYISGEGKCVQKFWKSQGATE